MKISEAWKRLKSDKPLTARQIANCIDVIYSGNTINNDIRKEISKAIESYGYRYKESKDSYNAYTDADF